MGTQVRRAMGLLILAMAARADAIGNSPSVIPPVEPAACSVGPAIPEPPPSLRECDPRDLDKSGRPFCARLVEELRVLARTKDPRKMLVASARDFLEGRQAMARAKADLAVTGRESFAAMRRASIRESEIAAALRAALNLPSFDPRPAAAATQALSRARQVAWILRGPPQYRMSNRASLGWIAVSGEDDPPHRPVNAPAPDPYPQYDLTVSVPVTRRCGPGEELSDGLCYPVCKDGYHGRGPVCWQDCPVFGFTDTGLSCTKHSYGRGAGEAMSCRTTEEQDGGLCYPRCQAGYDGVGPVCWKDCPAGFPDAGASCTKDSYGRGDGEPLSECPGKEKDGALCYPWCQSGYDGVGPVCWKNCPTSGFTDSGASCTKHAYGRGAGVPMSCKSGLEQDGALCYPKCKSGYDGVGPVCWQKCPSGYSDHGATCFKDIWNWWWKSSYGRGVGEPLSACPDMEKDGLLCYPKCQSGYEGVGPVCWRKCPSGFADFGAGCSKPSYGRGAGEPMSCAADEEQDGALCYPRCSAGHDGVGPVCWRNCPDGYPDFGVGCTKPSYGRGAGVPLSECPGKEKDGLLCYPWCKPGYDGVGPVCWRECPAGFTDTGTGCNKASYGRGIGKLPGAYPGHVRITTRFLVASATVRDVRSVSLSGLPGEPTLPPIPGDIILSLHGLGSRAEEAMALAPQLMQQAAARGRPVTVISMDLPSSGYASMVEAGGFAGDFATLGLVEEFVVELVNELARRQPGLQNRIIGVIGGSLGGNLGLRLGRRDPATHPWLRRVVSWSAAGAWPSFSGGAIRLAPPGAAAKLTFGVDQLLALARTEDLMNRGETWNSRSWHFHGEPNIVQDGILASSDRWYWTGWPCRVAAVDAALRQAEEIYNPLLRRWHWRLAHEQLEFSHWTPDPATGKNPGAKAIESRLLFAAGAADNHSPERLYDNSRLLADAMGADVDGETLFVENTGHSMHTERPAFLADRILDFLFAD